MGLRPLYWYQAGIPQFFHLNVRRTNGAMQKKQGCGVGVGVGVGVGKFSSTPTPARSWSRLQYFFIISFLVKLETDMETEHYVLSADSHDGLPCTVLLTGDHYVFGQSLRPCSSFIYLCIPMKFCTM